MLRNVEMQMMQIINWLPWGFILLSIRIKQLLLQNDRCIKNINMDIEDNSIIGVFGDLANEFVHILIENSVMDGDVVLDYISMKADWDEYIKKVRLLTKTHRKQLNGNNLKVIDYINLIRVLDDVYNPLDSSLLRLNKIENIAFSDLEEDSKLKIEFITSLLKRPKLVLIEDFFELLGRNVKIELLEYLKSYIRQGNICLISSSNILLLKELTERVFYINDHSM